MEQLRLRGIFLICGFLGTFCLSALAQEATIVGTVTDPSDAAVPNVAIAITNTDTGQVRHISSNEAGQYVAPDLHIGHYVVRAEAAGFKVVERTDLVLAVGDRTRVDFRLEVGSTQQSITVEATPVAVQSDTGEQSSVITGQQVTQLATNGRSIYTLAVLVPGASNAMADDQVPTSIAGSDAISFNGLRTPHNIWLVDGAESDDRGSGGTFEIMPSMDAIAEFQVMTSNYGANYGLSSAGTMSVIFKSGTKQLHGGVWEFVRNNAFDAGTYLANASGASSPELRMNTFGFNVGGPVVFPGYNKDHNKTFFFYNMEWRRIINGGSIDQVVPNTATYAGGFIDGTNCQTGAKAVNPCPVVPTIPAAARTALASGGTGVPANLIALATDINSGALTPGQPFTTGTYAIPTKYLDTNAQTLLKGGIFPANNSTSGSGAPVFYGGANIPTDVREEIVRIDHHFNDKVAIFGHYVYDSVAQTTANTLWGNENVGTTGTSFGNPSYSYTIHLMHTISPTLLNEIAFNAGGNKINFIPNGVVSSGLNLPRIFTTVNPTGNTGNRNPGITLSGTTGSIYGTNWCPWYNSANDYQIRDDVSWVKGTHQLKLGGSWALYKKVQQSFTNTEGGYTFSGFYTGNDFADFLLGMAASDSENAFTYSGHFPNTSWAAYAQDNWRATRKLTLNLGVRWDGVPHTQEENGETSNFYANLWNPANAAVVNSADDIVTASTPAAAFGASPVAPLSALGKVFYLNGIGIAGQSGISKGLVSNHWANFGPRIGFAYDLTGSGKTVVRGGFGIMYERQQGNDMYNTLGNIPFGFAANPSYVALSNPNLSLVTGSVPTSPTPVSGLAGLNSDDYKLATSMQYSVGVQRQLGRDSVLSIAYVGNQNRHQYDARNFNLPPEGQLANIVNGVTTYDQVVPYSGWGALQLAEMAENSHYNSLQVSLRSRVHDLTLEAAYTLSRTIDPGTGTTGNPNPDDVNTDNPYDRNYDRGPSFLDRTDIAFVSFVYDLPLLRHSSNHLLRTVAGGWEISGIGTMETGLPLNITLSGTGATNGVPNSTNRPDRVGSISYPKTFNEWVSPAALGTPAAGDWGTLGRGAIRGPGRDNWNISIFKDFVFSEKRGAALELRFESFNTFNHTEFNTPNTSFPSSSFGSFNNNSGFWDPRIFQFAAKLKF